jgi:hypothetical protein
MTKYFEPGDNGQGSWEEKPRRATDMFVETFADPYGMIDFIDRCATTGVVAKEYASSLSMLKKERKEKKTPPEQFFDRVYMAFYEALKGKSVKDVREVAREHLKGNSYNGMPMSMWFQFIIGTCTLEIERGVYSGINRERLDKWKSAAIRNDVSTRIDNRA